MALDFIAGCIGGCAGLIVGHPLDTVKVRLQTQDYKNPTYRGTMHCFSTTLSKEGFRGLYKGMSSPMAGIAVVNAILFGVQRNTQRQLSDPDSLKSHFVAGAIAGLSQSMVASPMELAKTRMQLQEDSGKYKSPLHCIRDIYRTEGIRGVFRGQLITIYREVPGFATYFSSYEAITRYFAGPQKNQLSTPALLLAGGSAGCISWVVSYPSDVIKSRIQAGTVNYNGMIDCFVKSYKAEGLRFLTRGLNSAMLRSFPTNAATFAAVTWVLRLAGVEEAASSDCYISTTEFTEEMLRVAIATSSVPLSYNASLIASRKARADLDALSANGEEEEERHPIRHHPHHPHPNHFGHGSRFLGTALGIRFREVRDVESALMCM